MYNELEIIKDKQNGMSIKDLVKKHNIKSVKTIYDIIERKGKKKLPNKKYNVNSKYFKNIDSEEKAYWLGFLYADGYVRMKENRSGELRIKLKRADKEHIKLLNRCLESNYKIKDLNSKVVVEGKQHNSKCSSLSIYNTEIVQDLFDKGCINNKTQKIRLPNIEDNLMRHFIRGYFDGDGSISNSKNRPNSYSLTVVSNKYFNENLIDYIKRKLDISYYFITEKDNFTILHITRRKDVLKMRDYLYEDSTFYLKRKKDIFENVIPL